jgi:hypothetical protein
MKRPAGGLQEAECTGVSSLTLALGVFCRAMKRQPESWLGKRQANVRERRFISL